MNLFYHIRLLIKKFFNIFGLRISQYESELSKAKRGAFEKWETLTEFLTIYIQRVHTSRSSEFEARFISFLLGNFKLSQSQLFQDVLVMFLTDKKSGGYFVEFGATNGLSFSNTYSLENELEWNGILAEPALIWHKDLKKNRNCHIDSRCVWEKTGQKLGFNQTQIAELSTITDMTEKDNLATSRVKVREYFVTTVSLKDLLDQFQAPKFIDFLSIDTEGSEFMILNSFNFNEYEFGIICVEHNFNQVEREKINNLLERNKYQRILSEYSSFDDWYVNMNIFAAKLNCNS